MSTEENIFKRIESWFDEIEWALEQSKREGRENLARQEELERLIEEDLRQGQAGWLVQSCVNS
jgi:hypothetical protein